MSEMSKMSEMKKTRNRMDPKLNLQFHAISWIPAKNADNTQHITLHTVTGKGRDWMTCAENPPPSLLKQDGLCTQGLYCRNQSWEIETGGGVCENVSASWFDTLKKKGWKKLPLDWKMEIDVGCWLFFFYVHPYARMGTLRRSNTKAKTEETHAGEGAPEFS